MLYVVGFTRPSMFMKDLILNKVFGNHGYPRHAESEQKRQGIVREELVISDLITLVLRDVFSIKSTTVFRISRIRLSSSLVRFYRTLFLLGYG